MNKQSCKSHTLRRWELADQALKLQVRDRGLEVAES